MFYVCRAEVFEHLKEKGWTEFEEIPETETFQIKIRKKDGVMERYKAPVEKDSSDDDDDDSDSE